MKRREWIAVSAALLVVGMSRRPSAQTAGQAQTTAASETKPFTAAELDQLMAPIALYPDPLLAQVLMAATYPLEVVEAARWSWENRTLKGEAALAAVKDKGWDVSVTSLVAFPQVLAMMDKKLDWTQKIGDAMIAQQSDVAASIQRLRAQAKTAGTLKSTPHQTVTSEAPSAGAPEGTPPAIVIQPANPDVVYVPTYDPNVVYGPWPYANDPPYYYPPPSYGWGWGGGLLGGLAFGVGFAVGGAFFGGWAWGGGWGGGWGWGGWGGWGGYHSYTTINVDRATHITNNFNRNYYHDGRWHHDPAHRHGVPYRDRGSREKYGQHHDGAKERQAFRGKLDHEPETSGLRNAGRSEWNRNEERPGNEGRGNEGHRNEGHGNQGHPSQRRNSFNGVNRGHQVHHEAERGHAYAHHASHPARHTAAHHGGGGGSHHGGGRR